MLSKQASFGSTKPEQISDGSPPFILRLEAHEFPIEYIPEDILRIDKVLLRHLLILPRVVV